MTAVTAYSKAKSDQLLAENIVNAALVGDNLVLYRRNGSALAPMNVRGASGAAASTGAINDAVAAAIADMPQGMVAFDSVGTNQSIAANGGDWYLIATLSITRTIVAGRAYSLDYSSTITSGTSLLGLDLEPRVGATFSSATPLDRCTTFVYDSDKGLGMGGSAKFLGVAGVFEGSKTFQIGVRVSGDSDLSVRNDPTSGGNKSTLTLIDHGVI